MRIHVKQMALFMAVPRHSYRRLGRSFVLTQIFEKSPHLSYGEILKATAKGTGVWERPMADWVWGRMGHGHINGSARGNCHDEDEAGL